MAFVRTDGTIAMDDDYSPELPQQVVTLAKLNERLAGLSGNSQFLTTDDSIPNTRTGAPYIFQFEYLGNQSTYVDIEGYTGAYSISNGKWIIQDPIAGTYTCTAYLRERASGDDSGIGREMDSIAFTFVVTESPTDITFVSFGSLTMPSFTWGQAAAWPVQFTGTGPIQLGIEGTLQTGVNLITSQLLDQAQAAVSIVTGTPLQEGSYGGTVIIKAHGATGVTASATASVTAVLRSPQFVGLSQLPIFPASGSGAVALAQFVRGYPAPTLTADPSLDTIQAGLSLSGYDILYTTSLISLQGTQSNPITFTLTNALSESATTTLRIAVQSAGTVPLVGTIFSWTQSNEATSVSGATVSTFNDVAQGAALQMRVADGVAGGTGPTWDQTNRAAQFRQSAKSTLGGLGIDAGIYPNTVTMRANIKSTTPTGTRQLYGSNNEGGYLNIGTGGASTVSFLGTTRVIKVGGSAVSNNLVYLSLSSQPAGIALLVGWPAFTGNISTVTVSSASSGGSTVPLSLVAAITGSNCLSQIFFVGDTIPPIGSASALWINVVYGSSNGTGAMLTGVGVRGSQNMRVVDAKTLASTGTNASVTLSKSGVQALVLSSLCGRMGSATDLTIIGGNTQLDSNDFGASLAIAGYQTTVGSANAAAGWSTSAASWAVAAIAVAESGGASTRALGIGVSAQPAYTSALSADVLYDVWNSYIFSHRNASQGAIRVNATVFSVSGTAVGGTLNDFYLGGATGADFDLRAIRVHYGAFDIAGSQGTAEIAYLSAQDATVLPPSVSTTPVAGLLDTDPRRTAVINAWRGNAWHTSANSGAPSYFITSQGVTGRSLAAVPQSGLLVPNLAGQANQKRVWTTTTGAGSVDVASGRQYYMLQVDNDTQYYVPGSTVEDTVRVGLGATYRSGIYGNIYWQGFDLVFDPSMYSAVMYEGTFNISIGGIHHVNAPGISGTPFTLFVQKDGAGSAAATFGFLRITTRRHPLNTDGTLNTTTREEINSNLTNYPMTAGKRYVLAYRYRLDGSLAATGFLTVYLRENNTWLNNGNPILNYTGRLGYQLSNQNIEQRPFPALYNWATSARADGAARTSAWPATVNNIIDSGRRGFRFWSSKGLIIREQSLSGQVAVNRNTVAAFLDSLTDGS